MCFAIAPEQRSSRGRLACAWWRVAHSPFRLLLLGTLMQGLLLVVVAASSAAESTPPVIPAIQFILVYGIAGSLIFGTLLNWLPEWFNRSPVEYGWYAITNVLMIAGAAFVVTGLYRGGHWVLAGAACYLLAWLVALRALWWVIVWLRGAAGRIGKLLLVSQLLGALWIIVIACGYILVNDSAITVAIGVSPWLACMPALVIAVLLYKLRNDAKTGVVQSR